MEKKEYKEIDLNDTKSVKISYDNEEITGITELEEEILSLLAMITLLLMQM